MYSTPCKSSSPRRRRAAVAVLIPALFLTVLGCATTGVNRGQLNLVSYEEEWKLGRQLEGELAKQLRLVNDASALAYVNRIGQKIAQQSEASNLPWKFHIVADPEINAFNIPGGHVYVNTGLILAADNASELAGVMAHEIGHGVARHATERISAVQGLNLGSGLLLGSNPSTVRQLAAQIAAGGLVAKYSRNAEREADQLGVRYMYEAGYDPNGMATMFEELMSTRRRRPSSVEQFFSTHPLAEDRIANVRRQAQNLPSRSGLTTGDGGLAAVQQRVKRYGG